MAKQRRSREIEIPPARDYFECESYCSTMTIKAEFIGVSTLLRCFVIISVFKYLHANLNLA